jgi:Icc-related predicted phosphoesterase
VETQLCANGIKAINLTNKLVNFEGDKFYGFPYVPYIEGNFNYELHPADMLNEIHKARTNFPSEGDWTLVAHAPIRGILDELNNGEKIGNVQLLNVIDFFEFNHPSRLLCGHIHESHGIARYKDILCSNAATTQHIICI